jgi:hypothetical protein
MTLHELLDELDRRGVRLEVGPQEGLVGHGDVQVEDLLDDLREHRDRLVAFVKARETLVQQGRSPDEAARLGLEVAVGGAGVLALGAPAGSFDRYAMRRAFGSRFR